MQVMELAISDVKIVTPVRHDDERGFFSEVFNRRQWEAVGITQGFVQDNHSLSRPIHTLRGLHFQVPRQAIAKLIRVVRGSIFDVAVDIRHGSPTFGQHVTAILSDDNWQQILVPEGFAHGFLTLEPDTEVVYKVTDYWSADVDAGIRWDDPDLGIEWPLGSSDTPALSPKDAGLPYLSELPVYFEYEDVRA